ncbi:MAG: pantoate--beta-alanine ligase [Alphaproteobacteria bacterium]|nr:pantoate--beta-alanine ligase [Alphaproteobacteria bacterium]
MLRTEKRAALEDTVARWKAAGQRVAFVPTMGALHEGHLSLVRLAKQHAERVVVSIFVNPAQFAPHEDFGSYPRTLEADLTKLQHAGVDLAYTPLADEIYPKGQDSDIKAGEAAKGLESDFRPHFFDGVVNVVARLFEQVKPDIAIFGEKDYQQLKVVEELVQTLGLPIEIIGAPIARDAHGLALSSRNAYLSAEELAIARKLNVILRKESPTPSSRPTAGGGEILRSLDYARDDIKEALLEAGFDKVDYVEERWGRKLAAAWLGKTRLIDNIEI